MRVPSESSTPVSSSDSTPATISIRRSLIAWITCLSMIAGATPRRRRRVKTPSSGTGRPYSERSPISLLRAKFTIRSARSGRMRSSVSAMPGPIGERTSMFVGVAERIGVAVLGGVQQRPLEAPAAGPVGNERRVVVAAGHDHVSGRDVAARGAHGPAVGAAVDALHPRAQADVELIALRVGL